MKFFARRLVRAGLLLLGVSVLCFLLMQMAPGSFFDELRLNPQVSPQTIAAMRMRYGLDRPMIVRFGCWLWSAARGDLGYSIAYHAPVTGILWTRAKNTLLLTVSAMFLTWMISIPLGVWAAVRRGHWSDRLSMLLGSLFVAVPEVVIALALLAAAVRWKFLPAGGLQSLGSEDLSLWGRWLDVSRHMVLPLVVLTVTDCAIIIRHVRASFLEIIDAPFVQGARGLGITPMRLLFRHLLPVAANPMISLFGFSVAGLLSGSLIVEVVCGWPGLGPLILEATLSRDLYLVIGAIVFSTIFLLGGNLLADVALLALDPRIRSGGADAP